MHGSVTAIFIARSMNIVRMKSAIAVKQEFVWSDQKVAMKFGIRSVAAMEIPMEMTVRLQRQE